MGKTLVEPEEVVSFLGLEGVSTPDRNIELIQNSVEKWVKQYCRQDFILTAYKERYDGKGTPSLYLRHYPIVTLNKLCVWNDDAISIYNDSTCAFASVSVTATAVNLYVDGTTTPLLFASYATLQSLVNAINAVSGWSASLMLASYATYPSTILLEKYGLRCSGRNVVYLEMPDVDGEDDFEVFADEGRVELLSNFPTGRKNVFIDYTAGYAVIPDDLKLAVLILIKNIYQRRSEESFGNTSYSISGLSISFEQDIPVQAKQILDRYTRFLMED